MAGDVVIVAALPDPAGTDRGNETVTLVNTTPAAVDLAGWALADAAGGRHDLTGSLPGGSVTQVTTRGALALGNRGDTIVLVAPDGVTVDQASYTASTVRPGRTICFGR